MLDLSLLLTPPVRPSLLSIDPPTPENSTLSLHDALPISSSATSSNSVAGGKHGERNSNACLTPLIFGPRLLPIAMMVLGILWVVRRLIVTRLQENFHDNF